MRFSRRMCGERLKPAASPHGVMIDIIGFDPRSAVTRRLFLGPPWKILLATSTYGS